MARSNDTYRGNNPSSAKGRGKLRRILKAQEKTGETVPNLAEIREAMEEKHPKTVVEQATEQTIGN
jgi:hypothetical protein